MRRGEEHDVVIAGGGPTGMVLAAELRLAGVDAVVLERRATPLLESARGGGLHARVLELLDQRGIVERFLAAGETAQVSSFAGESIDISDLPTRHPYGLALWQNRSERLLADWAQELGVRVLRGRGVAGLEQDDHGVDVHLDDGERVRARWLVGCDGGRSLVRCAAGIGFPGTEPTMSSLVAEAAMSEEPVLGMRRDAHGVHAIGPLEGGRMRIVVREPEVVAGGEPTAEDLSRLLVDVYGSDFGLHDVSWVARFTDAARQADAYRRGRVLLVGDAAHVHSPVGGQGLGLGIQDAMNLGWKLGLVARGAAPPELLDSYDAERRPAGARVLRMTLAQTALMRSEPQTDALRTTVGELAVLDEPRRRLGAELSGLDVHYDLGEGHPLLGRRMPDLDLATADGPRRVSTLLRDARPLLLDLGTPGGLEVGGWDDRVRALRCSTAGPWDLPAIGEVPAPTGVLVRPDGHVAWVGDGGVDGLVDALTAWFGPPSPVRAS